MNKKKVAFILTMLITVAFAGIVYASVNLYFEMPMTTNVVTPENMSAQIYIDNTTWANNTAISWGDVEAGGWYTKQLQIYNDGDLTFQVTTGTDSLPVDWSITYDEEHGQVVSGEWLNGTLTLLVSPSATPSFYGPWTFRIFMNQP